jgi:hypothetical protein
MCSTLSIAAEQPRINKPLPGSQGENDHKGMDEA